MVCKLAIVTSFLVALWIFFAVVYSASFWNVEIDQRMFLAFNLSDPTAFKTLIEIAAIGSVMFCVSWFASSFLSTPAIAVFAGLVMPLLFAAPWAIGWPRAEIGIGGGFNRQAYEELFYTAYVSSCIVVSVVCFALGCWIFLRRMEP